MASCESRSLFPQGAHAAVLLALLICTAAAAGSCSRKEPEAPPRAVQTESNLPITEVVQTFLQDYDQTWDNVVTVLNERGIAVQMANKELGRIVTSWVPVEDFLCGVQSAREAPIACRVQFSFTIARMVAGGSSVNVRYLETCADREEMSLVCPKSKGEKLMIALIEDMKARASLR